MAAARQGLEKVREMEELGQVDASTIHISIWANFRIGDAGVSAIAAALQHTPNLCTINLNRNQIGGEGASAIAAAL